MKRRGFLKGLGIITGGAALLPSELLNANEDKLSNEPPYDIKIVTNIIDSEEGFCTVQTSNFEIDPENTTVLRKKLNKEGIAYITLPADMKFRFVDISVIEIEHQYTTISDIYITDTPQEIMIFSRLDGNYKI